MSLPTVFDGTDIDLSLELFAYIVSKRNIYFNPFCRARLTRRQGAPSFSPMMRASAFAVVALMTAAVLPQSSSAQQPLGAEAAAQRDWLFEALRTAPTEEIGNAIADQIWRFWMRQAPDEISATLMNQSMARRREYDFAGAMEYLNDLVEHAPDWSEAWNQRATVLFFQENYDRSLDDVEKVLELEPKHFGALAGKAVILMRQGRMELGQKALREALAIHPWLKERTMLLSVPGESL